MNSHFKPIPPRFPFATNQFQVVLAILWTLLGTCAVLAGRPGKLDSTQTTPDACRCSNVHEKLSENDTPSRVGPWEAIILRTGKTDKNAAPKKICSGTILNDRMILTSVSCAKKSRIVGVPIEQARRSSKPILKESDLRNQEELTTGNLQVLLGVRNDSLVKSYSVEQILVHPNFAETFGTIMDSDFAILLLKEKIEFDKLPHLSPVCLLPSDFQLELQGQRVRTLFWKFIEPIFDYGRREVLPTQFVAHVTTSYLFPNQQCKSKALKRNWISDKYVCHSEGRRTTSGGGHYIELSNGFPVLIGMGSYQSLYGTPGLKDFKQIALISSITEGRQFIEDKAKSLGSWTCSVEAPDSSPPDDGYNDKSLDDLEPYEFRSKPWLQFTSEYRRLLPPEDGCKCGIKKDSSQSTASKKGRVWRGEDVKVLYEYPWHCNAMYNVGPAGTYACGCSIINNKLLLTAGHCVAAPNSPTPMIRAWAKLRGKDALLVNKNDTYFLAYTFLKDKGQILLHPFYGQYKEMLRNGTTFEYDPSAWDFGILVFNDTQPLDLGKVPDIGSVCVPYSGEDLEVVGKQAQLVGNGIGLKDGGGGSKTLIVPKFMQVKMTELNSCRRQNYELYKYNEENRKPFPELYPLHRTTLCSMETNNTNYVGADQGDSGSALFLPTKQQGSNTDEKQMIQIGVASRVNLGDWKWAKSEKWPPPKHGDDRVTQMFTSLLEHETLSYLDMLAFYHNASWCGRY